MATAEQNRDRRQGGRASLRVVHRHRIGSAVSERVSDLVYINGHPFALLGWVDLDGIRTPLHVCELDPTKLRADADEPHLFHYDDLTAEVRFAPDRPW
jgi:hypothetical protein